MQKINQILSIMKKLGLVLFLACTTFLTSCSNDDDASAIVIDEALIIGEWDLTDFKTENGRTVTNALGETITAEYSSTGRDYNAQLTFSENPKTFLSSGGYTAIVTTTTFGQTVTEEQVIPGDFISGGSWRVENNQLIVTDINDNDTAFSVLSQSDDTLIIRHDLNQVIDILGVSVTTTGVVTYTLNK